jgi:hypothetical protein
MRAKKACQLAGALQPIKGQFVAPLLPSELHQARGGQKKTVAFTLIGETLSFWDVRTHSFVAEPGAFDVLVGSSSEDIRIQTRVEVK